MGRAAVKLKYARSEIGVHHLVDTASGKTVVVVVERRPDGPRFDGERVARTIEDLWNDHEEGK